MNNSKNETIAKRLQEAIENVNEAFPASKAGVEVISALELLASSFEGR